MRTIPKEKYLEAAQLFHWATREHFVLWMTGKTGRHKRTEVILPRLVSKGKLTTFKYGRKLAYAVPRINRRRIRGEQYFPFVEHGLGCTEGLIRFWISKHDGVIIPERYFRGGSIVPEWGILYPRGLLLYEFCTYSNFMKGGNVKNKIVRYKNAFPQFHEKFQGPPFVIFVVDVPRPLLIRWLADQQPIGEDFYFTDYSSFKAVPIGAQVTASIYIWGADGKEYSLK